MSFLEAILVRVGIFRGIKGVFELDEDLFFKYLAQCIEKANGTEIVWIIFGFVYFRYRDDGFFFSMGRRNGLVR